MQKVNYPETIARHKSVAAVANYCDRVEEKHPKLSPSKSGAAIWPDQHKYIPRNCGSVAFADNSH